MAVTAEIQTVVTYDGFNTISKPILYSYPAYSIFQIKGELTFTGDERYCNLFEMIENFRTCLR